MVDNSTSVDVIEMMRFAVASDMVVTSLLDGSGKEQVYRICANRRGIE